MSALIWEWHEIEKLNVHFLKLQISYVYKEKVINDKFLIFPLNEILYSFRNYIFCEKGNKKQA